MVLRVLFFLAIWIGVGIAIYSQKFILRRDFFDVYRNKIEGLNDFWLNGFDMFDEESDEYDFFLNPKNTKKLKK